MLSETEGCELLAVLEQSGRLLFHISDRALVIEHDPQVAAQQIIAVLQRKWQEVYMKKLAFCLACEHDKYLCSRCCC